MLINENPPKPIFSNSPNPQSSKPPIPKSTNPATHQIPKFFTPKIS